MIPAEPKDRTEGEVAAHWALTLSWLNLRTELRATLEAGTDATRKVAPRFDQLDTYERDTVDRMILNLQAIRRAMPACPDDDHPAWLDAAINRKVA